MRFLVLALMLLPTPVLAADYVETIGKLEAWAKPVNCKQERLLLQDKIICQRSELRREDQKVYETFRQMLPIYQGRDRLAFVAGQDYWRASQRGGCDSHGPNYRQEIAACEKEQMDRRLKFLERLKDSPALLQSTVADYEHVEPWYVRLFPKQYAGKEISLFNFLLRKDSPICTNPPKSLKGRLEGYSRPDALDVEFSGTDSIINGADSIIKEACDADYSTTDWHGVVKLDGQGKPYLYITEVGLVHLPGSK